MAVPLVLAEDLGTAAPGKVPAHPAPLTSMNSALEPTCWRKHSRKFSSVGRIWASCGDRGCQGGSRSSGCPARSPDPALPSPAALLVPQPRPPPPPASLTSAISILPSAFLSYLCMNSFILSPSLSFQESCRQRDGSGAFSLPCCHNLELFFPSLPIPSLQDTQPSRVDIKWHK